MGHSPSTGGLSDGGLDTLRLSESQWSALVQHLDAHTPQYSGKERRREARAPCERMPGATVRVEHPGGSKVVFRVRLRNISPMGLGFLQRTFIHPQSRCTVVLPTLAGNKAPVNGKVVRCGLLSAKLHEVGVEFDSRLSPADFIGQTAEEERARSETELPSDSIFLRRPPKPDAAA